MNIKSTALLALLVPGIAMLAACNRTPPADDAATPPVATAMPEPAPADPMPAAPMPDATAPAMAGADMAFADMDKNKDGGIAKDELTATDMLYEHFSVADADGDGKLSDAEVSKHRADMAAAPAK